MTPHDPRPMIFQPRVVPLLDHAQELEIGGGQIHGISPIMLPERVCVSCGSQAPHGRMHAKTLYHVNPLLYLSIFLNVLVFFVFYLIFRKKLDVRYYLCPACQQQRRGRILLCGAITSTLTVGTVAAFVLGSIELGVLGTCFANLGVLAASYVASPRLRITHYDEGIFSLKGASPLFLSTMLAWRRGELPSGEVVTRPDAREGDGTDGSLSVRQ